MTQKQLEKEYMKQPDASEEFRQALVEKKSEALVQKKQESSLAKKTKRIKLVVNLCFHEQWEKFLSKGQLSKSTPRKYEYGFTRAVAKLDNCCASLFYKSKNFCMAEWGPKVFFQKMADAGVGQTKNYNAEVEIKKVKFVAEMIKYFYKQNKGMMPQPPPTGVPERTFR